MLLTQVVQNRCFSATRMCKPVITQPKQCSRPSENILFGGTFLYLAPFWSLRGSLLHANVGIHHAGVVVAGMLTPAAIFFINTDLLCCCSKAFISPASAVATLLWAYCVVRADLHFSRDLIKNLSPSEVCNLGAPVLHLDRTTAAPSSWLSPKHVSFSIVGLGKYRRKFARPFFLPDFCGILTMLCIKDGSFVLFWGFIFFLRHRSWLWTCLVEPWIAVNHFDITRCRVQFLVTATSWYRCYRNWGTEQIRKGQRNMNAAF